MKDAMHRDQGIAVSVIAGWTSDNTTQNQKE